MQAAPSTLWTSERALVLASASKARRQMLTNAGIRIEVVVADIDERKIEEAAHSSARPREIASLLAEQKALSVSARLHDRLVLGADQTLDLDGVSCSKSGNAVEAAGQLRRMSGRRHTLHSAFCFARNGEVVHAGAASAELSMRPLTDDFIAAYLEEAGPGVLGSVGVYEIEGLGVQLFDAIDGDWFTILGLPLPMVINFLRAQGCLRQ